MDEPPAKFGPDSATASPYATTERVRFEDVIPNFVSQHVRKKLDTYCAGNHSDMKAFKPSAESAFAAVVMADVSGYSALTAILAERGPVGAEILAKTMKGLLDKASVIQIIIFYGGDIVKFIGDAIMFYWKLEGPLEETDDLLGDETNNVDAAEKSRRAEMVLQAAICCSEILKQYGTYPIDIPDCSTTELKIHLGIGAGKIYDVHVGGEGGRWEHFIGGEAVSQLATVLDQAPPGLLAMSHQALKQLNAVINVNLLEMADYSKKAAVIPHFDKDRIRRNTRVRPTTVDDMALWDIVSPTQNVDNYKHFINYSALFKLQSDINQSKVFSSEFPGLTELMSLFELRQATTLFVRIGGYAQDGFRWFETKDDLEDMQTAMEVVQKALFRFQGSLRQFHVDDKGAILLAFFGLPPHAHENDAQYGIRAALEIAEEFTRFFEHFSIGITTGVIAIGGVGNSLRTEYALMGDSINMAARLMCLEAAHNAVACDERTYNLCVKDFVFEDMGTHKVKGKRNLVKVFRPKSAAAETKVHKSQEGDGTATIVGRKKEKVILSDAINSHVNEGGGGLVVLEGDGGMGLTTLMKYAKLQAVNIGCPITSGSGSEMERTTPYFTFRDIIGDILTMVDEATIDEAVGILIPMSNTVSKAVVGESSEAGSLNGQGLNGSGDAMPLPRDRTHSLAVPDLGGEPLPDIVPPLSQTRSARSNSVTRRFDGALSTVGDSPGGDVNVVRAGRSNSVTHKPELLLSDESSSSISSAGGVGSDKVSSPGLLTVTTGGHSHPKNRHRPSLMGSIDGLTNNRAKRRLSIMATNLQLENQAAQKRLEMEERVKASLVKLGEAPAHAQLLNFVMPFDLSPDTSRQLKGRGRQKEFHELVKRIICTLSANNPIAILFHEAQWMDISSWELLLEIINGCPDALVVIFSRPDRSFDDKECAKFYSLCKKMSKAKIRVVEGLTEVEIAEMIRYYWNKDGRQEVKKIGNAILSNVHRRTNGNPLYARSLVIALKESGQTHVEESGELQLDNDTAFDFEHFSVDDDLQSIVVAQFDRLDRNFQLLLKVGSAFGHRFVLEEVLVFLPDTKALTRDTNGMLLSSFAASRTFVESQIDKKLNAAEVSRAIGRYDKYGFLQKVEGEHGQTSNFMFEFKSALIRRCVYNIMTVTQRQQLHYKIANYYETQKLWFPAEKDAEGVLHYKLRPDGLRFLIPVYEHYSETSDENRNRKIMYLVKVSHYHYKKHMMAEAIKYYKKLFQSISESQMEGSSINGGNGSVAGKPLVFSNLQVACMNQELGDAYLHRGELEPAERHLHNALRLCDVKFPKGDIALSWAIRKERTALARSKPDPDEEIEEKRLLQEKTSVGSSRRESKSPPSPSSSRADSITTTRDKVPLPDSLTDSYQPTSTHISRLALLSLTDLYLSKAQQAPLEYCALLGLNVSEKLPKDTWYARFKAVSALALWLSQKDEGLVTRYLNSAEAWDDSSDANAATSIASLSASVYFMMGQWSFAHLKYETLYQIGLAISDQARREESLRIRSIIHLFEGNFLAAQRFAMELLRMAERDHFWPARYWGTALMLINELHSFTPNLETLRVLVPSLDFIVEQKEQQGTGTLKTPFNPGLFAEILATAGRLKIAAMASQPGPVDAVRDVFARATTAMNQMKPESLISSPHAFSVFFFAVVTLALEAIGLDDPLSERKNSMDLTVMCQAAIGFLKADPKVVRLHQSLLSIFRGFAAVLSGSIGKKSCIDWEEALRKATKHKRPWIYVNYISCRLIVSFSGSQTVKTKYLAEKSRIQSGMESSMSSDVSRAVRSSKSTLDPAAVVDDLRRLVGATSLSTTNPVMRASGLFGLPSTTFSTGTVMRAAHSRAMRSTVLISDPPPGFIGSSPPSEQKLEIAAPPTLTVPPSPSLPIAPSSQSPPSPSILEMFPDSNFLPIVPGRPATAPLAPPPVIPSRLSQEVISEEIETEQPRNEAARQLDSSLMKPNRSNDDLVRHHDTASIAQVGFPSNRSFEVAGASGHNTTSDIGPSTLGIGTAGVLEGGSVRTGSESAHKSIVDGRTYVAKGSALSVARSLRQSSSKELKGSGTSLPGVKQSAEFTGTG
ncbi:hypothetical protein HDU93_007962 [Gonapodya sp. JEL0774]|nr:hypothetical protein HDU93_007962 [Gonapodya sp. JEL0774]